jgi:hypothetical protein
VVPDSWFAVGLRTDRLPVFVYAWFFGATTGGTQGTSGRQWPIVHRLDSTLLPAIGLRNPLAMQPMWRLTPSRPMLGVLAVVHPLMPMPPAWPAYRWR